MCASVCVCVCVCVCLCMCVCINQNVQDRESLTMTAGPMMNTVDRYHYLQRLAV